jgi:1,2-diacylglycerol-3-alpha-glucose alpha-1,2-galactosyltransferase
MKKITVNMKSTAQSVPGQGVGSAYAEQVALIKQFLPHKFRVYENAHIQADITHYHTINPTYFLSRKHDTAKGVSLGYVHMLPETVEHSLRLPLPARKVFYAYMLRFYKSMDYLVTVNPYFIGELEKYGVERSKVSYIPNFVSKEKFHPLPDEEIRSIKAKYGIPQDKFVVMSAGQLQVRKGAFDFLALAKKMPDICFVWAGGFSFGRLTDGYDKLKKAFENPPPNLKFLGIIPREEMNGIYNAADVMMLASFEELFPMTILEAMCVGKPVLLRDLDIYHDILFDFYLRAQDKIGFAREILHLKKSKKYYAHAAQMSVKGNAFYSRENVVRLWDELYTRITQAKSPN